MNEGANDQSNNNQSNAQIAGPTTFSLAEPVFESVNINTEEEDLVELYSTPSHPFQNEHPKRHMPPFSLCGTQSSSWRAIVPNLVCSVVSNISFHWLTPLLLKGFKTPLTEEDLSDLDPTLTPHVVCEKFEAAWCREEQRAQRNNDNEPHPLQGDGPTPSLWRVLGCLYWGRLLFAASLLLIHYVFIFGNAMLIEEFIRFIGSTDASPWYGVSLAVGLFVSSFVLSLLWQHYNAQCEIAGLQARVALSAAVYRKCLRLNVMNKGDIVTLVATDVNKIFGFSHSMNQLWGTPILFFGTLYQLWNLLGISVVAAVVILALVAPLNYFVTNRFQNLQDTLMELQEKRMRILSEVLQGILVVKFFGWEPAMKRRVESVREEELKGIKKWNYNIATIMFVITGLSTFLSVGTFSMYALLGNALDATVLFPAIYLFGIILWPLLDLPWALTGLAGARTSVTRLRRFLCTEELPPLPSCPDSADSPVAVRISSGEFWWPRAPPSLADENSDEGKKPKAGNKDNGQVDKKKAKRDKDITANDSDEEEGLLNSNDAADSSTATKADAFTFALRDINLEIKKGQLIAIVGEVGAGKSALLQSLLGELHRSEDTHIEVNGSVAYIAQQAWIQNTTVRNNVLFGRPYDEERYSRTLEACALLPDLAVLPAGDATEIGERGVNLSGGQKQRVNMARGVYGEYDIYLFDDPLSAVDAHVGRWLFDNCIRGELLKDATRILVTHQLQYLPHVDSIILLKRGRIVATGTYTELAEQGISFASLLEGHSEEQDGAKESVAQEGTAVEKEKKGTAEQVLGKSEPINDSGKLMEDEERYVGSIGWGVYKQFLLYTGGVPFLIGLGLLCLAAQAVEVLSKGFLAWQSSLAESGEEVDPLFFLAVFTGFGVLYAILVVVRMFSWFNGAYHASRKLHSQMLSAILRAPMSFFHSTPHGRILNRFSKDQNSVDQTIPDRISDYILCMIETGAKLLVVIATTPLFLVFIIPIGILYWFIQQFYRCTARELTRLDSISSSPVYAHFSESVEGAVVIRAFKMQRSQILENNTKVEANLKADFPFLMVGHWMGIWVQMIGSLIIVIAAGLTLGAKLWGYDMDAAYVGLALSYAISITNSLNWMVVTGTSAEAEMSRVERILHYCAVSPEASLETSLSSEFSKAVTDPHWPHTGKIEFHNAVMSYKPTLPPVLKNVSFSIRDKEKVGVCGRTGAGKSSLMLALFRIVELSEGKIVVDGVDISQIGLHDLRRRVGIIPQDPVLFSGSVRSNLDPLEEKSDKEVWESLRRVNMEDYVLSLPDQLQYEVEENGRNFSVGQRQLLCMARSLLEDNRILIMDEATANVDSVSDQLIQKTVREVFKDRTVLTIAHRLPTIIDMDRILVMDGGEVVELDTPHRLLQDENSFFSRLVADTGASSAAYLRSIAQQKEEEKVT